MKTIEVTLAGADAFGNKHLEAIRKIDGVEVVSIVGRALAHVLHSTADRSTTAENYVGLPFEDRTVKPQHPSEGSVGISVRLRRAL